MGVMGLKKERKRKAPATARKNRRSWKRWLEGKEKELEGMVEELRKMEEEKERMEEEGRSANSEMEEKESELGLIKQDHMLAIEESAAIQGRFDETLLMLAQDVRAPSRRRRRPFFPGSDGR